MTKFEKLGREILRHKYLYYIKMEPEISDYNYDMLEREYVTIARTMKKEPKIHMIANWNDLNHEDFSLGIVYTYVGFPDSHPWTKELLK